MATPDLFETLLQIRHKVKNVVVPRNNGGRLQDPSLKLLFQNCGFKNVIEIDELQEIHDGNVHITGLPFFGEHADLDIMTKLAWLVRIGSHSLLFAADSCNIEPQLYEHLHREIGNVDALFLGMECDGAPLSWLYGPLLTQKLDRAMDESAAATRDPWLERDEPATVNQFRSSLPMADSSYGGS